MHTSDVEVTNVSQHGIWVLVSGTEHFLSFKDFPWFRDASVANILNVQLHHQTHLHWPALDIDLSLESIKTPERFPLVSRQGSKGAGANRRWSALPRSSKRPTRTRRR